LHLNTLVGDFKHPSSAIEQQAAKVGDEPKGVDVDAEIIDDNREFVALLRRVKLHLVTHQKVEWHVLANECDKTRSAADVVSGRRHT
jgi:hypothetical protein